MKTKDIGLRSNSLWRLANEIASFIYKAADMLVEEHPDEKFRCASKLYNAACDGMFSVSTAIAGTAPGSDLYDWNFARKNFFGLQSIYIFAGKQKLLELSPEIVLKIDELLVLIDSEIAVCRRGKENEANEDMEPWLKKYAMWREMQG